MEPSITTLPGRESAIDLLQETLSSRVREVIEELVQAELDEVLGAVRHERTGDRAGYRNGSYERQLVTEVGPTRLTVSRARIDGGTGKTREHQSEILPRYERRIRRVNDAILGCYTAGANSRRICKALQPLLGTSRLSKSAISCVVIRLKAKFDEWMARDRGLRAPQLLIADGNRGLLRAIRETWPLVDIQRCTKHKLENLLGKAPKHCHGEIKRDYRDIVYADALETAQKAYDSFCAECGQSSAWTS